MTTTDDLAVLEATEEIIPLLSQQMMTAIRVMAAVGHNCGLWRVPGDSTALLLLTCDRCPAEASIHLIDAEESTRYTVLLLPPGSCPLRSHRLVDMESPYVP